MSDNSIEIAADVAQNVLTRLLTAFIAEFDCKPSEAEFVAESSDKAITMFLRKRANG